MDIVSVYVGDFMNMKEVDNVGVTDKLRLLKSRLDRLSIKEYPKVSGEAKIIVRDAETMKILREQKIRNVITIGGLEVFAQALASPFTPDWDRRYYWYLVLGIGSGTPSNTDTSLFTPVGGSAKHGSVSSTGSSTTYYVRYMPEEANGYTYTEAGIYDKVGYTDGGAKSYDTGVLINHLMLSPTLEKTSAILVDFYITITFS